MAQRSVAYGYQNRYNNYLVEVISRRDFLHEFRHDYRRGQHVSAFGPTGRGKSTLMFQCLGQVISPDHQVISLHGKIKGRDPVVGKAAKALDLRVVSELPSASRMKFDRQRKYNGYLLVPLTKPMTDPKEEERILSEAFEPAIMLNYTTMKRKTITHINEAGQTQHELGLQKAVEAPLQRGGPDNAVWNEAQRGAWLSYHTYGAPEHIFVFYDPVKENRKRYADFGTEDPDVIEELASHLKTERVPDGRTISQCLYMRRSGGMCVIDT